MPSTLDYAGRGSHTRSLAIPAFICGVLSGPGAIGLALLVANNGLDERTKELLGLTALILGLGGAFTFSCVVRVRLPASATNGIRLLANFAIAAPVLWAGAIVAFIMYALSQV
jgi:hypothetical protein